VETSQKMEFSCFPITYFSLAGQCEAAKVNPYSNKWSQVFDFNQAEGEEHWSVSEPYNTPEKLKSLLDFKKCANTDFGNEVLESVEGNSSALPAIPFTVGSLKSKFDKSKLENRLFVLFLEDAKVDDFMVKFHEKYTGKYEILTAVLTINQTKSRKTPNRGHEEAQVRRARGGGGPLHGGGAGELGELELY